MSFSQFFSLTELTHSNTAVAEGIANQPGPTEAANLSALCRAVLDPLRQAVGQPIKINSGYRGPALNKRIGGAADSQHLRGQAADIQSSAMTVLELFKTVIRLGLPFDQLIYEARSATSKWVHVSHDVARTRGEVRIAEFDANGKPVRYPVVTREQALAISERVTRSKAGHELSYTEHGDEPAHESAPAAPTKRVRAPTQKPAAKRATPAPKRPAKAAAPAKAKTASVKKVVAKKLVGAKVAAKKVAAKKVVPKKAPARKAATR